MSDLISRQAAIDALTKLRIEKMQEGKDVSLVWECLDKIMQVPSAQPEHGRWKPWDLTWGRSIYYCTSCGNAGEVPTEMGKPIYEYCPYCGAKMDGESYEE